MPTIKNFSTKKDVLQQLKDAGATIKLGFEASSELDVKNNPFKEFGEVKNFEGKKQEIKII